MTMNTIPFCKMSGAGNDFVVIDNRNGVVPEQQLHQFITGTCRRRISVGADGVILIEHSPTVDFKWRFFNADGSLPDMCGNGARCAARYTYLHGITGPRMAFETLAGTIEATVLDHGVKIRMTDPKDMHAGIALDLSGETATVSSVNTGVPHVVMMVDDIQALDVVGYGRRIRNHRQFAPEGTNVNFVDCRSDGTIFIRTYERGVEDETLACGTGNVATALTLARDRNLTSPVSLITRSGAILRVHFNNDGHHFKDVYLEGDARIIYHGELCEEAWQQ